MIRTELEAAIVGLNRLLDDKKTPENKYQRFFEENPVIFEVLGYQESYPQPRLPLPDGEFLIPDFLAKRVDGFFEIIDLKLPQEKILKSKQHRNSLYAKIYEYMNQVKRYAQYFDEQQNRSFVKSTYGYDVQKRPSYTLIAGRDASVDKKGLYELLRDPPTALHIITYDQLLSDLLFYYVRFFGHAENLPGASCHIVLTIQRFSVPRRKYIFDCGEVHRPSRWSIFVDEHNRLTFELTDLSGRLYTTSIQIGTTDFKFDEQYYVVCEWGSSDRFSLLQILVNNRIFAKQELAFSIAMPTDFDFSQMTIGADFMHKNNGKFICATLVVYNRVLAFTERAALVNSIFEKFFTTP